MTPEPLPEYELLTEPFLRQWGAVEGMKTWNFLGKSWMVFPESQPLTEVILSSWVFCAELGTMAMVSTPLPLPVCEGCEFHPTWGGQHWQTCPSHPRNALVKVPPGLLARLKKKPDGLLIGRPDEQIRWQPYTSEWPAPCSWSANFAYALPARVLAEIEGKEEWRDLPKHEYVKVYRPQEAKVYCTELGVQSPFSTTTSEEVKTCATQHAPAQAQNQVNAPIPTAQSTEKQTVASNAAPPKSQPSEAAATWNPENQRPMTPEERKSLDEFTAQELSVPATSPTPVTGTPRKWDTEYHRELDYSERLAKEYEASGDTHGMNFHQGRASALISVDIMAGQIFAQLETELAAVTAERDEARAMVMCGCEECGVKGIIPTFDSEGNEIGSEECPNCEGSGWLQFPKLIAKLATLARLVTAADGMEKALNGQCDCYNEYGKNNPFPCAPCAALSAYALAKQEANL